MDWMLWLVKVGRFSDALKLSDAFIEGSKFTTELETGYVATDIRNVDIMTEAGMMKLLTQMINLAVNYQDGNMAKLESVLAGFPENLQDVIADCLVSKVALALNKQESATVLEELCVKCEKYLELQPENYEVIEAMADILTKISRQAEANKLYETVKKNSHNGLLMLDK